jgi:poly-D-alanine transfer protein DltD
MFVPIIVSNTRENCTNSQTIQQYCGPKDDIHMGLNGWVSVERHILGEISLVASV